MGYSDCFSKKEPKDCWTWHQQIQKSIKWVFIIAGSDRVKKTTKISKIRQGCKEIPMHTNLIGHFSTTADYFYVRLLFI